MAKRKPVTVIVADNLTRLMRDNPALNTLEKLAAKSRVGRSTIDRIKKGQSSTTIDNLELVARAFRLQAQDLLIDNSDPAEAQMLSHFRNLNPAEKKRVAVFARQLEETHEPDIDEELLDEQSSLILDKKISNS